MAERAQETDLLTELFLEGVRAVSGKQAVANAKEIVAASAPTHVLSVGKAACAMYLGLDETLRQLPALIVTKHGHSKDGPAPGARVEVIESSHPVPNEDSLAAGKRALEFVGVCGRDYRLLMLVSGGASALVEALRDGYTLADLETTTRRYLSDGSDIHAINAARREISRIKGGGLLAPFEGRGVQVLAISDVSGDDIGVIGSGIGAKSTGDFDYDCRIIASNEVARSAIAVRAQAEGLAVIVNEESLYDDVNALAKRIAARCISGPPGLYIFGGEPTVELPDSPGRGGRNQALGLLLAKQFQGRGGITCLVAGTDGSDGVADAAGAIVDGESFTRAPGAEDA